MSKLSPADKKKLEENLKYISLPVMSLADDNLWIKSNLKVLPERYRQEVAYLYGINFFRKLHDKSIPELKRKGQARESSNALLRNIVDLYQKSNLNSGGDR